MSETTDLLPLGAGEHALSTAADALKKMEAHRTKFDETLAKSARDLEAVGDHLTRIQKSQILDSARKEAFHNVDGSPEYRALLVETEALRRNVEHAAEYYGNEMRMAELSTFDDPKRAQYASTVRGLGHAALRTLAEKARAEGNHVLAVVLAQELQPMEARKRPFDPYALVRDTLPKSEKYKYSVFARALETLDRYQKTRDEIRLTRHPSRAASLNKIKSGLRAGLAREPRIPRKETPAPRAARMTPTQRVAAGLRAQART